MTESEQPRPVPKPTESTMQFLRPNCYQDASKKCRTCIWRGVGIAENGETSPACFYIDAGPTMIWAQRKVELTQAEFEKRKIDDDGTCELWQRVRVDNNHEVRL